MASNTSEPTQPLEPTYNTGHEPVVPPLLVTGVPRLADVWFSRFADVPVTDITDAVGALYVMSPDIAPLYRPIERLVGQALTVKAWPGDNLAVHGGLALVQDGDVLVVDWRGHTASCGSGANNLALPIERGLRGIVIDGAWRDVDDLQEARFPIFGRARTAFSPARRRPGEINVSVSCGGVVVSAGDLVVGDSEGVVIVPRQYLDLVWNALTTGRPTLNAGKSLEDRRIAFLNTFELVGGVRQPWSSSTGERPGDQ